LNAYGGVFTALIVQPSFIWTVSLGNGGQPLSAYN